MPRQEQVAADGISSSASSSSAELHCSFMGLCDGAAELAALAMAAATAPIPISLPVPSGASVSPKDTPLPDTTNPRITLLGDGEKLELACIRINRWRGLENTSSVISDVPKSSWANCKPVR